MSKSAANFNSALVLPTPEKTIFFGLAPAFITFCNSPPETTSNPNPLSTKFLNIFRLLLAFTE